MIIVYAVHTALFPFISILGGQDVPAKYRHPMGACGSHSNWVAVSKNCVVEVWHI